MRESHAQCVRLGMSAVTRSFLLWAPDSSHYPLNKFTFDTSCIMIIYQGGSDKVTRSCDKNVDESAILRIYHSRWN